MLPKRLGVVFIMVTDMERSVAFYRDVLGLPLRFQSPYWSEFALETVTLALHGGGAPEERPRDSKATKPAASIHLSWYVEDLDAACAALKERGVRFTMEPTDCEEEGIRLAEFLDPDGAALGLCQVLQSG